MGLDIFVDEFRKNGKTYLENMDETELVKIIQRLNDAYYNNTPVLNDNEYDIVKEYAEVKYPKNTVLFEIGAPVVKHKTTLPYAMPSMDKIKPDTMILENWMKKYKDTYVISHKLDGVSGLYSTEGTAPKLYTRGNGTVGQDVTNLLRYINLPKKENVVVRGEFIIPKDIFEKKYKTKFSNARNLVSGIINSKEQDEKIRDVHFVVYEMIIPHIKPSEQMNEIDKYGFEKVVSQNTNTLSNTFLSDYLLESRKTSEYEIDGIIVSHDDVYERTNKNPEHAFAFKMVITDQVVEAKVVDVIWTASKAGYLKPRVRIEPVRIGGVKIEYATGFNAKFIEQNQIGIGAVIRLIRSGDVIPYIQSVTEKAEHAKMPEVKYHWTDTRVDIILDDLASDETVKLKNITEFFTKLGVDGLSSGNVKRIMEAGYDSIEKIIKMKKDDYEEVRGFKETMINKIHDGIHSKLEQASLIDIMVASNLLGRGLGSRKITPIMDMFPDILFEKESDETKIEKILQVKGIGKENAKSFVSNIDKFNTFLELCNLKLKYSSVKKTSTTVKNSSETKKNTTVKNSSETKKNTTVKQKKSPDINDDLYGKNIVMTKVRDKGIIGHIEKNGGKMEDTVNKNTYLVITKSHDDTSNKIQKANDLHIPIYTVSEFITKYVNKE